MIFRNLVFGIVFGIPVLLTIVMSFPNRFEMQVWSEFPSSFGGIWSYYGFEVDEEVQMMSFNSSSFCICRSLCFVKNCSTFSMKMISQKSEATRVECRFTSIPIHNLTLYPAEEIITEARENSFQFFHGDDGVFYQRQTVMRKRDGNDMFIDDARTLCRGNYHNGRLPILKTFEQYDSYWNFREINYLNGDDYCSFLDMTFNKTSGKYSWSDGTPFEETEIYNQIEFDKPYPGDCTVACVRNNERIFEVCFQETTAMAICQIDPFRRRN